MLEGFDSGHDLAADEGRAGSSIGGLSWLWSCIQYAMRQFFTFEELAQSLLLVGVVDGGFDVGLLETFLDLTGRRQGSLHVHLMEVIVQRNHFCN